MKIKYIPSPQNVAIVDEIRFMNSVIRFNYFYESWQKAEELNMCHFLLQFAMFNAVTILTPTGNVHLQFQGKKKAARIGFQKPAFTWYMMEKIHVLTPLRQKKARKKDSEKRRIFSTAVHITTSGLSPPKYSFFHGISGSQKLQCHSKIELWDRWGKAAASYKLVQKNLAAWLHHTVKNATSFDWKSGIEQHDS